MSYLDQRRAHIEAGRPLPEKKKYRIPNKSAKRIAKEADQKKQVDEETEKQKWFLDQRHKMVGVCQCGCGNKSQKENDKMFRHCICHIFPQRLFPSIQFHPLNWVERRFFMGCHTNMDNRSMDLWPKMADWDDIKEKFHQLAPLLTDQERTKKFYSHLEGLVYNQ